MVVYPTKHRVDLKILLDVINPRSRIDGNIAVSLRLKKFMHVWGKLVYPTLNYICAMFLGPKYRVCLKHTWEHTRCYIIYILFGNSMLYKYKRLEFYMEVLAKISPTAQSKLASIVQCWQQFWTKYMTNHERCTASLRAVSEANKTVYRLGRVEKEKDLMTL